MCIYIYKVWFVVCFLFLFVLFCSPDRHIWVQTKKLSFQIVDFGLVFRALLNFIELLQRCYIRRIKSTWSSYMDGGDLAEVWCRDGGDLVQICWVWPPSQ